MKFKELQDIIFETDAIQRRNNYNENQMLILLKERDFQSLFHQLSKDIIPTNGMQIPTMFKYYGFEFRPHNIENQDVLICLKHKAK